MEGGGREGGKGGKDGGKEGVEEGEREGGKEGGREGRVYTVHVGVQIPTKTAHFPLKMTTLTGGVSED